MKKSLDRILVVEGKEDASYLSNYIASEIVVVNGYELDKRTIEYLKNNKVIALLDPDTAGLIIRERLNDLVPGIINVEIDINKCTRGVKTGVAECEIDEIMNRLSPFFIEKAAPESLITSSDLYSLGISNGALDSVCDFCDRRSQRLTKRSHGYVCGTLQLLERTTEAGHHSLGHLECGSFLLERVR